MVSYHQPAEAVSNRGPPPSITSRSAAPRRHRNSRSHTGGASFRPQNEFPDFSQTGDVEIIISADGQEKRYMLHRLILAQCSGFFDAGTSEDWSRAQARAHAAETGTMRASGLSRIGEDDESSSEPGPRPLPAHPTQDKFRWRYELDWGTNDDEVPMLVQKVSRLRPPSSVTDGSNSRLQRRCLVGTHILDLRLHQTNPHLRPLAFSGQWLIFLPCNLPLTYHRATLLENPKMM